MKRRALLAATGTVAAGLAGCLDRSFGSPDAAEWSHDVGGQVDSVADGRVFFTEAFGDDTAGDGSVTALDAGTGDHLWSYGSSNGLSTFTDLTVGDAVYVGYGDDAVGSGSGELYALELDGNERWTFDTGSVYERPRLRKGTVYVGSDDGVVRAIDATDGSLEWRYEVEPGPDGPPDPSVEAVSAEAVYVAAGRLLALDPGWGDLQWQFGDADTSVSTAFVDDGRVSVRDSYDVRTVRAGEEVWEASVDFESFPRLTVDDGRVFVRADSGLLRLDADDGTKRWTADVDHLDPWTVHGDRVYAAGTELFALDAEGGDERWNESVGDGPLDRLRVAEGDATGGADHAVFVEQKDEALHRVTPDGEVTWSESVPGDVRSFVVDDLVYVGTDEGVHAYAPG